MILSGLGFDLEREMHVSRGAGLRKLGHPNESYTYAQGINALVEFFVNPSRPNTFKR